jgi:hypothetical protein
MNVEDGSPAHNCGIEEGECAIVINGRFIELGDM